LRLARAADGTEGQLRAIPGVLDVRREDGQEGVFLVEAEGVRDVREQIAERAVSQGWGLLEMRAVTLSLEDIFIRIIQGEAA